MASLTPSNVAPPFHGPQPGQQEPLRHKTLQPLPVDPATQWYGTQTPPVVRRVTVDQSSRWISRGWEDMTRSLGISLTYGLAFVAIAYAIVLGLRQIGMTSLVLPMMAGFMLVGPLAAVGLYDISRRHGSGETPGWRTTLSAIHGKADQLLIVGLVMMMAILAWMMVALLIFASFYNQAPPSLDSFLMEILSAEQAPLFLLAGTVAGGVIAAMVFTLTAISLPMIMDRDVSAVAAMATSARAVMKNWRVMIGWAAMIVLVTGFGLATFFIGLAISLPLIGHASWHAYRAMVD
ncbi:DUF2189 domain-containing protein [Novispirillum itersonii]|uniref:Putative membrane protein n=1 Tax=Novispirillum itersonii TaxID=189 RepID=A0A7W9ZCJ4_NOVIT|nr:DUF2189 domain-containing protein [Novispirillum itersonii]MBB6208973.1 putative membrane protein [Novispirillum itersonii]